MKQTSACTLDCPGTCSLLVVATADATATAPANDRIVARGHPDHPFTAGRCCVKGAGLPERLARTDRITQPLLRRDGELQPIEWDRALDLCAARIQELRDTPEAIAHLHGHGYRGVLAQAATQFFRALSATGLRGSLCDDTGIEACKRDFGALTHNAIADLANAARIVNWGRDLSRSSIHMAGFVTKARKKGAQVLTISPGGDGNGRFSDVFVRIRPGTDRFLAAAVLRVLDARGDLRETHLARMANWPETRRALHSRSVEELCAVCGCTADDAVAIADWYGGDTAVASIIGWGLQRYVYGGENVRWINALCMASGHVGRGGGGAYFNISSSRNFGKGWEPGTDYGRTFAQPRLARDVAQADPPVRMAWVDGFNVVNQAPEAGDMARVFEAIPFTVVVDAFMNDTVRRADLVLPAALPLEREEVLGSCMHDWVQHSAKVLDAPGLARSDHWIMREVGRRLDPPLELPDAETWLRNALCKPELSATLETLREHGWARGEHPAVAFADLRFGHEDGLFHGVETLHDEPAPDEEYPLQLLTLVRRNYIHSQIPPEDQTGLPVLTMAAARLEALGLDTGRPARLETELGSLEVSLATSGDLHPDAVIVRRGGWMAAGWSANPLIAPRISDMAEGAAQYSQPCRVVQED